MHDARRLWCDKIMLEDVFGRAEPPARWSHMMHTISDHLLIRGSMSLSLMTVPGPYVSMFEVPAHIFRQYAGLQL